MRLRSALVQRQIEVPPGEGADTFEELPPQPALPEASFTVAPPVGAGFAGTMLLLSGPHHPAGVVS